MILLHDMALLVPTLLLSSPPSPQLYNEDIIDLFDESARKLRIHEDPSTNNIYVAGATELKIESEEEV